MRIIGMRIILIGVLLIGISLAGCSSVSSPYIIEIDRVDQEIEGNRGYLSGTPPAELPKKKFLKRTLIGIDVEIPILPGEKGYKSSYTGRVIREKDIKMEPKVK